MRKSRLAPAFILAVSVAISAPVAAQQAPRELYVQAEHADELDSPSARGKRMNRIYARQAVTVYEVRDGWARVTAPGYNPRWVEVRLLGPVRPAEQPPVRSSAIFSDPRIEQGSLPTRPGRGLDARGVEMVWRAARRALDEGCPNITDGDRSTSRPDIFWVTCSAGGEARNRHYTGAELTRR